MSWFANAQRVEIAAGYERYAKDCDRSADYRESEGNHAEAQAEREQAQRHRDTANDTRD
jgi:hypothetical protein